MKSTIFLLSVFLLATTLSFADPIADIATILQEGASGEVTTEQTETPGSPNTIQPNHYTRSIRQNGASSNYTMTRQDSTFVGENATMQQYGNTSAGSIELSGSFNKAIIVQSGNGRLAIIRQTGNGNSSTVVQH